MKEKKKYNLLNGTTVKIFKEEKRLEMIYVEMKLLL